MVVKLNKGLTLHLSFVLYFSIRALFIMLNCVKFHIAFMNNFSLRPVTPVDLSQKWHNFSLRPVNPVDLSQKWLPIYSV